MDEDQMREYVMKQCGTEPPFQNAYWNHHADGTYRCAGCGAVLFSSETKFDSGTGWPSFTEVASSNAVTLSEDATHGMRRTEVSCASCGGHLGHVFPDGPMPGGNRFCINSAALRFEGKDAV